MPRARLKNGPLRSGLWLVTGVGPTSPRSGPCGTRRPPVPLRHAPLACPARPLRSTICSTRWALVDEPPLTRSANGSPLARHGQAEGGATNAQPHLVAAGREPRRPPLPPKEAPIMAGSPTVDFLHAMERKRESIRAGAESICMEARAAGRETLNEGEAQRLRHAQGDLRALTERIEGYRSELERAGTHPTFGAMRAVSSAGQLAPLGFPEEEMRHAYERIRRGESAVLESRDPGFASADSLLPAQLFPIPTFPRHEDRLIDQLPGFALDAPSLEYVQVNSVTGAAGIVGEGQAKPEITMPATKLIISALKLAAHAGISWENINDYDVFSTAVKTELLKKIVDLENQQIVYGTGGTTQLSGLLTTAGILTFTATGTTENFTDIAGAIATLRTGPALAKPDLLLLHPDTWANIRTQKDQYGRFLATVDPTSQTAETVWDVPVVQSTEFTVGEAVLLDSTLFGRIAVRESLVLRMGYSGTDFTDNVVRWVAEERLNVAVERPAAICHITALPATAPTTTATKTAAKK